MCPDALWEFTDYGCNHSATHGGIYASCTRIYGVAGVTALMLGYQCACEPRQRLSFNQYLTAVHKHKFSDWLTDWLNEELAKCMIE